MVVAGALLVTSTAPAESFAQQSSRPREPARTMSYRGAPWLERVERAGEERPDEVIDAMRLQPGEVVADVGVGSGYFARRIARSVGPEGHVYGVDIQPEMLRILEESLEKEAITNVEPVLGGAGNPNLPTGEIDWILLVDVYHEFSEPARMLARMRDSLAPGGRVALLEYRLEDATGDHIYADHRMSVRQVLAEWQAAGYELVDLYEFLPSQHMFILRDATDPAATRLESGTRLEDFDLFAAIELGLVEVDPRGSSREEVELGIRRTVDRRFVVTAPAGTFFTAQGDYADMVARSDAALMVDDDDWKLWRIRAATTHWDKATPTADDRFELRPASDDGRLTAVVGALQAGTYRVSPDAESVTYAPQTIGVAESAVWIALADPSYEEVERWLGDSQVPGFYAAAFGLVLCERAGIDIQETRMWNDRATIFDRVELRELSIWYASGNR
jgi:ubiquinone/menaquinone biosynthesis C-methylase UbiE